MSLLMDALKKAEEAKRQAEAAGKMPATQTAAAAEAPAGESGSADRGLPELPSRLELLDEEFHSVAKGAQARPKVAEDDAARQQERAAAQNLFAAKQAPARSAFPLVVALFGLVAAAGIGAWFWWQLQPSGGVGGLRPAAAPPPARAAAAPAAQPAAAAPDEAAAAKPAPAAVAAAPKERSPRPAARAAEAEPAEPASPIRITAGKLKMNPAVGRAYQALTEGDLATARRDYEQVLKGEPKNTDALHGLAAISLRQGRPDAAEGYYLSILEADPKDASAQAGLIGLRNQADPLQSESRLKTLLAGQPDSPFLNFALGNLYARQGRWNEAQQAYFQAYSADAENPDYQFNLAVSLEQLRQSRLALQYYQGALAAAAHRPAAFDKSQAEGRIRELQQ